MAAARWVRPAFRIGFTVYCAGLLGWLLLGLLPTLAADFGPVHQLMSTVAAGHTLLAGLAGRVLDTDDSMVMTAAADAWLQYGFSVLNLSLGLLLALRQSSQRVPRLLAFALLGTAATFNDPSHRAFHITGSPWPVALVHFTFHVASGVCYVWGVVLFPDGELPRKIRLPRAWLRIVVISVTIGIALLCWFSSFLAHPQFFVIFFGVGIPLVGVGSQLLRLRDPAVSPLMQAPSRLLCAALLPALGTALLWLAARFVDTVSAGPAGGAIALRVQALFPIVFAIVPIVLYSAIVRYRLWDIDRLLSRVLVYGVIIGGGGVVYVFAVAVGGWLARGELWWTVLTLAAIAALIEPMRIRAGRWANRVVYGQLLSPTQAIKELAGGLEQLSPAGGLDQIVTVTVASTRVSGAALWLLDGDRLIEASSSVSPSPGGDLDVASPPTPAEAARLVHAAICWPISYQDRPLGFLAVQIPAQTNLTQADRSLIHDVAAHAGLLVHNALLGIRLARQVAELAVGARELQRARRRLVQTQDAERRRLERDLHDGAQQALVAAIIGIRSVRARSTDAQALSAELAELQEVLVIGGHMLDDLLTAGRPAVLADQGLAPALEQAGRLATRRGLQVTVVVTAKEQGTDREFWNAAELAVYFCCAEALQNIAKYAEAEHAFITVDIWEEQLRFEVIDDGKGFDRQYADIAGGLARLAQRCELLGGTLDVSSAVGRGTRICGRIPLISTEGRPEAVRRPALGAVSK